jgi:hypothetical protein
MQKACRYLFLWCILLVPFTVRVAAQSITNKTLTKLDAKAVKLNNQIDKKTEKALRQLQKQEAKLQKKLFAKDSVAAKALFANSSIVYDELTSKVKNTKEKVGQKMREYLPSLDSTIGSLKFINQNSGLLKNSNETMEKVKGALAQYEKLQNKIAVTGAIATKIRERKELMRQSLEKYGLGKYLKKYTNVANKYKSQLTECKAALKDPAKIEKFVLVTLNKIPAFKNFMQNFGLMGNVISSNANNTNALNMAGIQSRTQIQQLLTQQFGNSPATINAMQQSLQVGQQQLASLQNKLSNTKDAIDQPNFVPAAEQSKNKKHRLERGFSFNKERSNNRYIPNLANFGISLGYKIKKDIVVGLGANYKLGVKSTGIKINSITNEALGFKTFLDVKFTKSHFWLSAGLEKNYRLSFSNIDVLRHFNKWQTSCLFGLTKKISLKNKGVKIQLLYDVLANKSIPNTTPLIYRITFIK